MRYYSNKKRCGNSPENIVIYHDIGKIFRGFTPMLSITIIMNSEVTASCNADKTFVFAG